MSGGESENNVDPKQDEDFVDPWNVVSSSQTGVDYDKLIRELKILIFIIIFL